MAQQITQPIVDYKIANGEESTTPAETTPEAEHQGPALESMHEHLNRPDVLVGATYKVKPLPDEPAIYLTINDMILNEGTEHEQRHPFEVFVNSKNMEHFQWVVALTRIMSAVFRKGGDVTFIVEEMRSVFDPNGGHFSRGKWVPSMAAEIGNAIERHLMSIGLLVPEELDEHQKALIAEKRAQYEAKQKPSTIEGQSEEAATKEDEGGDFPAGAQLCPKCNETAMVLMDGCMTCLACGNSKCG